MSEPAPEDASQLVDLTSMPLDRVARLCEATARDLNPEDLADRPVLRTALHRIQEEAKHSDGAFCRHGNGVF